MKKISLILSIATIIAILSSVPFYVFASPSSVDREPGFIQPLISTDSIKASYFTATSTTATSTFNGPFSALTASSTSFIFPFLTSSSPYGIYTVGQPPFFLPYGTYPFINQYDSTGNLSNLGVGFCANTNQCLYSGMTGDNNTIVGEAAGSSMTTGSQNTVVGNDSLGASNIGLSGLNNNGLGSEVLSQLTSGTGNNVIGVDAANNITTGSFNTVLGDQALFNDVSGNNNIAIGPSEGSSWSGSNAVFIGSANVNSGNYIRGDLANASTTFFGPINIATSTATSTADDGFNIQNGCFAFRGTCISSSSGSSFAYPFVPITNYGATNQATTGIPWFKNGVNASSTSNFVDAIFNGNVGIGTNMPSSRLDLENPAYVNYDQTIYGEVSGDPSDGLFSSGDTALFTALNHGANSQVYLSSYSDNTGLDYGVASMDPSADNYFMGRVGLNVTNPFWAAPMEIDFRPDLANNSGGYAAAVAIADPDMDPGNSNSYANMEFVDKSLIGGSGQGALVGNITMTNQYYGFGANYFQPDSLLFLIGQDTPNSSLYFSTNSTGDQHFSAGGYDQAHERLTILHTGQVGVGTTTPWKTFSVAGDEVLTGGLFDSTASSGTAGNILMSTGSKTKWISTSTAYASLPKVTSYNSTTTAGIGLPPMVFFASTTGATGAITYGSYQPTATSTLMVGADVNILAVATDVINYRVSWTDEYGQAETINSSSLSSVGFNSIGPYTITVKGGAGVIFSTVLTTGIGSITYNTRAWAEKLQ